MKLNIESPHLKSVKLETLIQSKFHRLEKSYIVIEDTSVVLRKVNDARNKNCEIEAKLLVPKKNVVCYRTGGNICRSFRQSSKWAEKPTTKTQRRAKGSKI